ncbi:hypothetical protein D083_0698 [Dickeya solani RNS 08.23.3.1.A]|nr:hypothetical protein D083_0698 [Dickeya solani RNS 08.23.3.1.A]
MGGYRSTPADNPISLLKKPADKRKKLGGMAECGTLCILPIA